MSDQRIRYDSQALEPLLGGIRELEQGLEESLSALRPALQELEALRESPLLLEAREALRRQSQRLRLEVERCQAAREGLMRAMSIFELCERRLAGSVEQLAEQAEQPDLPEPGSAPLPHMGQCLILHDHALRFRPLLLPDWFARAAHHWLIGLRAG